MADLDDFFAKKDRKKLKNLKKFSTADEVAKKLEDTTKKVDKPIKKDRVAQQQEGDESGTAAHDADEWKDFEEEKKDYSGLKIGHLTISTGPEGSSPGSTDGNTEQLQGTDDGGNEPDRKSGPWKRMETVPPPPEPEKPEEPPRPTTGAYVAPSLRNLSVQQPSRLKSKVAPDIHNEEYFPTLSGGRSTEQMGTWGKRYVNESQKNCWLGRNRGESNFEEVRHNKASSHRQAEQSKLSSGQGPKLNLGNRYGTLSNEHSS